MPHSKIGPKEAQQRALREERVTKNKALIDKVSNRVSKTAKAASLKIVKPVKRSGRGR